MKGLSLPLLWACGTIASSLKYARSQDVMLSHALRDGYRRRSSSIGESYGWGRLSSCDAFVGVPCAHPKVGCGKGYRRRISWWSTGAMKRTTARFSVVDKVVREELSDMDARVLDELLSDPAFRESLQKQDIKVADVGDSGEEEKPRNTTAQAEGLKSKGGLTVPGWPGFGVGSSTYESVTMQAVEGLQNSVRGLMARVSATIESAGIFFANRAQVDTKVLLQAAEYTTKRATTDTGRLLLAATGAASPALALMGVNATEAQNRLNTSVQLMALGILPESIGTTPQLLGSLKDFDDEDKRITAAFKRQRRQRSKPLPAKILGALPSTVNKALDIGYEVEQEAKYEQAGNRVNKLLKPLGLALPGVKEDVRVLTGQKSSGALPPPPPSRRMALPSQYQTEVFEGVEGIEGGAAGVQKAEVTKAVDSVVVVTESGEDDTGSEGVEGSARQGPGRFLSGAFGLLAGLGSSSTSSTNSEESSRIEDAEELGDDPSNLARALAARPGSLLKELMNSLRIMTEEIQMQEERSSAAVEVLSSIRPVMGVLLSTVSKEGRLVDDLQEMSGKLKETAINAEFKEAASAVAERLVGLETVIAQIGALEEAMLAYSNFALERSKRLVYLRTKLTDTEALSDVATQLTGKAEEHLASRALRLWHALDLERAAHSPAAKVVGELVSIVTGSIQTRPRDGELDPTESSLLTAAQTWMACSPMEASEPESIMGLIKKELLDWRESTAARSKATERPSALVDEIAAPAAALQEAAEEEVRTGTFKLEVITSRTENELGTKQKAMPEDGESGQKEVSVDDENVSKVPKTVTVMWERKADSQLRDAGVVDETAPPESSHSEDYSRVRSPVVLDAAVVVDPGDSWVDNHAEGYAETTAEWIPEGKEGLSEAIAVQVVSEGEEGVFDIKGEVEDDGEELNKVALKALDIVALLLEKILFVGLPALFSGGALAWERVDNAINGAKGRKGWRLLNCIKKDRLAGDDIEV